MNPCRRRLGQALLLASLGLAGTARAQPAQTVVWSGFPPGGLGDQVTRPLLERLKGRVPGSMILDSKAGAGGRIAADFVKRAAPTAPLCCRCRRRRSASTRTPTARS